MLICSLPPSHNDCIFSMPSHSNFTHSQIPLIGFSCIPSKNLSSYFCLPLRGFVEMKNSAEMFICPLPFWQNERSYSLGRVLLRHIWVKILPLQNYLLFAYRLIFACWNKKLVLLLCCRRKCLSGIARLTPQKFFYSIYFIMKAGAFAIWNEKCFSTKLFRAKSLS